MEQALIELKRLLFDKGGLRIKAGSAYVFPDANGARKRTLLRILAGLEPADVSDITFLGSHSPTSPYPSRMRDSVVYVFRHPVMFSTTVEKNVAFGLAARELPEP